ncbi:MAG: (Fe-S)-binding protein [Methanomassiliicoccales archaeon]
MTSEFERLAKRREELEYCIRCGFCKAICPAVSELGWDSASARGRMTFLKAILDGEIDVNQKTVDRLYQCSTCGDCANRCPAGVDTLEIIEDARADLTGEGMGPERHKVLSERIAEEHNPYGEKNSERERFKKGEGKAEVLYFTGCTAPLRRPETVLATMDILDAAGVDYRVLGEEEWCCGSVLRRSGYREQAEELREHNVQVFKEAGVSTIVASCSGCFRTLKEEYGMEGIEVLDITEFVDRLMSEGRLEVERSDDVVTYHDPCHLGRHMGVYEAPRRVLERIATLVEMEHIRDDSLCCGAGGGMKSAFSDMAERIGAKRMEEAEATGADMVITPCPFCRTNLADAAFSMPVMDFAEYVASKL